MNVPTREGQAGEGALNPAFGLPQPERSTSPSFLPQSLSSAQSPSMPTWRGRGPHY